jgi:hypothetical protein
MEPPPFASLELDNGRHHHNKTIIQPPTDKFNGLRTTAGFQSLAENLQIDVGFQLCQILRWNPRNAVDSAHANSEASVCNVTHIHYHLPSWSSCSSIGSSYR